MPFTIDFSQNPISESKPDDWKRVWELIDAFERQEEVVLQSSGSTGKPSKHRFSHGQIEASARRTMEALNIFGGEAALVLPVDFTGGRMLLYRAMLYKMKLHLLLPKISFNLNHPVDLISVTPAQWTANEAYLRQCGCVLIGGGELPGTAADFPAHVYHTYGMTETLSNVALRCPARETHFSALNSVCFSKTDDNVLVIQDTLLGIDALETNDLVDLIDNKRFVFRGRRDKIVNSGGVKINLDDWHSTWHSLSSINVQAVGMPHREFGQMLVLLINNQFDMDTLRLSISAMPKHWRPKRIYQVEQRALTSAGKPKIFLHPQDIHELAAKTVQL